MIIRLLFTTSLVVSLASSVAAPVYAKEPEAGQQRTVLAEDPRGYQVVRPGAYGTKIQILFKGKVLYEVVPEYKAKIAKGDVAGIEGRQIDVLLLHDQLARRGGLKKQPKPFDDVNGDGAPDLLLLERAGPVTNAPVRYGVLRLVSIVEGKAEEAEPYAGYFGEMLHFDDFNKDGVLELVNTDQERYFLYSREGIPISGYVLLFDRDRKEYYPADIMVKNIMGAVE